MEVDLSLYCYLLVAVALPLYQMIQSLGKECPSRTDALCFELLIVLTHQYSSYNAVVMGDKVTAVEQVYVDFHQLFPTHMT